MGMAGIQIGMAGKQMGMAGKQMGMAGKQMGMAGKQMGMAGSGPADEASEQEPSPGDGLPHMAGNAQMAGKIAKPPQKGGRSMGMPEDGMGMPPNMGGRAFPDPKMGANGQTMARTPGDVDGARFGRGGANPGMGGPNMGGRGSKYGPGGPRLGPGGQAEGSPYGVPPVMSLHTAMRPYSIAITALVVVIVAILTFAVCRRFR
jgi:hypothetical protein